MGSIKINKKQFSSEVKDAGYFAAGMIAGAQVNRFLKSSMGGLGALTGISKNTIAPALTTAAGLAVGATMQKRPLRMMGFGVASIGGAFTLDSLGIDVLGEASGKPKPALPPTSGEASKKPESGEPPMSGLGYTLEELPPPVCGLGEGVFINDQGVVCDANGNPVDSLDDSLPMDGFTEGNGEQGGDGSIPGIGTVQMHEGVGDVNVVYIEGPNGAQVLENGAHLPAYDMKL